MFLKIVPVLFLDFCLQVYNSQLKVVATQPVHHSCLVLKIAYGLAIYGNYVLFLDHCILAYKIVFIPRGVVLHVLVSKNSNIALTDASLNFVSAANVELYSLEFT